MRTWSQTGLGAGITCCWLALASQGLAADLNLQIRDGRVTLEATNVPAQEILAEWARVGETEIVNAEKIDRRPVTLKLVDLPEQQALDIVLREAGVSGYVGLLRLVGTPGASGFHRVLVLASSVVAGAHGGGLSITGTDASASASPPAEALPVLPQPLSPPEGSRVARDPTAAGSAPRPVGPPRAPVNSASASPTVRPVARGARNYARRPVSPFDAAEIDHRPPAMTAPVPGVVVGEPPEQPRTATSGPTPAPPKR